MLALPKLNTGLRVSAIFCVCWLSLTQLSDAQSYQLLSWQSEETEKDGEAAAEDDQPKKDATLDDRDRAELDDLLALDITQLGNTEVVVQGFSEQVTIQSVREFTRNVYLRCPHSGTYSSQPHAAHQLY